MSTIIPSLYWDEYYVYAALFRDGDDGPGYVKFGLSRSITKRMYALRMNCPIPLRFIAVSRVGWSKQQTQQVEKALHTQFKGRNSTGEWFRFDFDSDQDKRAFNDGCRLAFRSVLGDKFEPWTKISAAALDANAERNKAEFVNSKHRRKIERRQRAERNSSKAKKELAAYGA